MPLKNFDNIIKEPDGSQYTEIQPSGEFTEQGAPLFIMANGKAVKTPIKFSVIISNLLKHGLKDEKLTAHELIENWALMQKIAAGGNIELTGKQVSYLEKLLIQSPVQKFIVGQIIEYLHAPEKKPEEIRAGLEASGGGASA